MAIIEADDISQAAVEAALGDADPGDTVLVPPGSADWTGNVVVPDSVALLGSGVSQSLITMVSDNFTFIAGYGIRISSFRLNAPSGTAFIRTSDGQWRIDHIFFNNTGTRSVGINPAQYEEGKPWPGLIDNCVFMYCKVMIDGNTNLYRMCTIWDDPLGLGTEDAVYIEDCEFHRTAGNCIDTNRSGKYVARHCTVYDSSFEAHSLQSPTERGTRSWEIYENVFIEDEGAVWVPMFLRGGTGVVFNNQIDSGYNLGIAIDNVRCFTDVGGDAGQCNGESSWDENQAEQSGYMCRDQIGAGVDVALWTEEEPYPAQDKEPAYFWNNKNELGNDVLPFVHNNCENWIQENRDYYVGVAKPGYTPYTYPHPLRGMGSVSKLVMLLR